MLAMHDYKIAVTLYRVTHVQLMTVFSAYIIMNLCIIIMSTFRKQESANV